MELANEPGLAESAAPPETPQAKKITSPDEARSLARLIGQGKISGPSRDTAMKALREFDAAYQYESKPHGDVKPTVARMSGGEKFARGFGFGAQEVARGARQIEAPWLSKIPAGMPSIQELRAYASPEDQKLSDDELRQKFAEQSKESVSDELQKKEDVARKEAAPVLKTLPGKIGNIAGQTAATSPSMAIPGSGSLVGAALVGGGLGAMQPLGSGDSRIGNALLGAAGGAVGQKLGQAAGYIAEKTVSKLAPAAYAAAAKLAKASPKSVSPEAARAVANGYKLPPSMAKAQPGVWEDLAEGIGGKVRTEQAFSIPNQVNSNKLARRALGLGEGESVDIGEVLRVRKDAGDAYQEIRNLTSNAFPGFNVKAKPNQAFQQKMDVITNTFKNYQRRFPSIFKNDKVNRMVRDINKPMTPDEAVAISSKLREDATANYRSPRASLKALGKAQKKAADAIDDLIEDHLRNAASLGNTNTMTQAQRIIAGKNPSAQNLYNNYRKARQIIARTYDVEKVLNEHTGDIDAAALARLSKKRPLQAELKEIADFGGKFEGAARTPTKRGSRLGPSISKSEIGVAAVGAALGHPGTAGKLATIAAYTGAPWAARRALLSKAYQNTLKRSPAAYAAERQALKKLGGITAVPTLQELQKPDDEEENQ